MIVCKNPRDVSSFYRLALQLEPARARSLYQAYLEATSRPISYLLCDLTLRVHAALRYRTCVFPDDEEGLCLYASDGDINALLAEDPDNYERFSEASLAPPPSVDYGEQGAAQGFGEHSESEGGGLCV